VRLTENQVSPPGLLWVRNNFADCGIPAPADLFFIKNHSFIILSRISGNMPNFWKVVNEVIFKSDVILIVLDARIPKETRNKEIEDKILRSKKRFIYVLNKCDLISKTFADRTKVRIRPSVFVSTKNHEGAIKLRTAIKIQGKKVSKEKGREKIVVGVLGYPNVGKSSVINMIRGGKAAKTSPQSGYTKGYQYVNAGKNILLIDTPGVLSYDKKDEAHNALIGAVSFHKLKEPDLAAMELIKALEGAVEKHYKIEKDKNDDEYDILEKITIKKKKLKKGGEPDVDLMGRMIVKDWQTGKIRLK